MRKLTNWLEAYQEFTSDFEPPQVYHKWAGILVLSIATGRKVWLVDGNRTLYPNLYVILVGPPGCGKGQAMREIRPYIDRIRVVCSPDKITAARLVSHIASSSIVHPDLGIITPYLLWAEELPSCIGTDAYETGMLSDLTTLYDCPDEWKKETKTRGIDLIPQPYVCVFGAITPQGITDIVPSGTIGQGFTSRLLFVYADYSPRRVEEKPWGVRQTKLQPALHQDLAGIAALKGPMKLSDVARVLWNDFYHSRPSPSDEFGDVRLQGYSSRKPMFVKKLSMLMSIAESDALIIEAHHIEQAIQLLKELDLSILAVYNEITPSVISAHYVKVMRALEKAKGRILSHSELMSKFSATLDRYQFKAVMEGLEEMNWIEREVVKHGQIKRFTVYYKLVNRKKGANYDTNKHT